MGCVSGRDCEDDERPVHTVRVERFELSKYEVTFEEYDRFTAATGRARADDEGWGRGRCPVINVTWDDAVAYTQWLSQQTGERYRLPSEAEWEYAARAGTSTAYSWGNEIGRNRANCYGCGSRWDGRQTAPVGSLSPNGWGLHDMHGNVWEWVQDCWNESYRGAPTGRFWVGERELFPARFARRLLDQRPQVPALREPPLVHHLETGQQHRVPRGPDRYSLNLYQWVAGESDRPGSKSSHGAGSWRRVTWVGSAPAGKKRFRSSTRVPG